MCFFSLIFYLHFYFSEQEKTSFYLQQFAWKSLQLYAQVHCLQVCFPHSWVLKDTIQLRRYHCATRSYILQVPIPCSRLSCEPSPTVPLTVRQYRLLITSYTLPPEILIAFINICVSMNGLFQKVPLFCLVSQIFSSFFSFRYLLNSTKVLLLSVIVSYYYYNYHKLGGLKTHKFIELQLRRLEALDG